MTCFLFFALSVVFKMVADWWVGVWSEKPYTSLSDQDYFTIFYLLGATSAVFLILRAIALGIVTQLACVNIFKLIIWNILRRPMSFFDTTPSGVIINRCTSDVDQLDFNIPFMMAFFLNTGFTYLGSLILAAAVNWYLLVFIVISFYYLGKRFREFVVTTIELKRIIQLSLAPILSLSNELIDGVVVIRAYNKKKDILKKYQSKADLHHTAVFHDEQLCLWIRTRSEWFLSLVLSLCLFMFVAARQFPK